MIGNMLGSQNVATLQAAFAELQKIRADLDALKNYLEPVPKNPEVMGNWVVINNGTAGVGGGPGGQWTAPYACSIVAISASADQNCLVALQRGSDQQGFFFSLQIHQPLMLDLTGVKRLPVAQGLPLKIFQINGTPANMWVMACIVPMENIGQKVK